MIFLIYGKRCMNSLSFFYKKILIFLITKANQTDYQCFYEQKMIEVHANDIEDFIFKNLRENDRLKYMYTGKYAIIYGPDVRPELNKIMDSFIFMGQLRFQKNIHNENILFFHNIPMIFLPTISGIHVVPDMTGKWSESFQKLEPTSFAKLR